MRESPAKKPGEEIAAGARTADPRAKRPPSAAEQAIVRVLMRKAEKLRRLRFLKAVPIAIENQQAIVEYIREELRSDAFERARVVYLALGMVPPDLDLEQELSDTLSEQVVGYYDPGRGVLVVRDDVFAGLLSHESTPQANGAREVLLHELIHALQAQHLGLQAHVDEAGSSDSINAYRALIEGDATLATVSYSSRAQGEDLREVLTEPTRLRSLSAAIRKAAMASPRLSKAPAILREPLLFAYCEGLHFVSNLWSEQTGFAAIDDAHHDPPRTTEEILHPGRNRRPPLPMHLSANRALVAAGYELVAEDTLGELELGIFLGQANPGDAARAAADGWDGDRVQVYRDRSGALAALWLTRWDRKEDAREMARAAARVLESGGRRSDSAEGLKVDGLYVALIQGVPARLVAPSLEAALSGQLDRPASAN